MPVTTTIDLDKKLIVHAVEGEVTAGDWVSAIGDRLAHPDFEPGLGVLWDFSNAPEGILSSRDLRGMLDYGRQEGHAARMGRIALLTPRRAQFAMASSVEKMSDGLAVELRAFQDRTEAIRWLMSVDESGVSQQASDAHEAE